ncbi:hypothetical protein [Thalassomonas haliotis]|uniref:Uncharacterized protein n=1 Tax=Thalassomonas haliotis TaxID=485448 RepID=A0ABY7V884_9GAMM|nr:hypothetical protein [Thalassomonas haliotis]WDE09824.1 hypothetical protein H3N35_16025 [Thalassomonas haliotis]
MQHTITLEPGFPPAYALLGEVKYQLAHQYSQQYISANPEAYSRPAIAWIYTMARDYAKSYQQLMKLAPYQHRQQFSTTEPPCHNEQQALQLFSGS